MPDYKDDIEKYLHGRLSDVERHRLEKKALSDPFLAEALEGAESLSSVEFSQDLNNLDQKINTRKSNSLFWPIRIAAGIIVIISITIATIKLTDSDSNNQLALQKQNPAENMESADEQPPALQNSEAKVDRQDQGPTKMKILSDQADAAKEKKSNAKDPVAIEDALPSTSGTSEQNLEESEINKENFSDQPAEQKAVANVQESTDRKTVNEPSYTERAASAPSAARSMTLNKKSEGASGASMAKEDIPSTLSLSGISAPTPVGGLSEFNKYVEANLRYPQRALNNNIQGDVIIEFQINANGSYENFTIITGLGNECNEEAIRLIKEGPKWSPAIEDGRPTMSKQRVTIPFRLKK